MLNPRDSVTLDPEQRLYSSSSGGKLSTTNTDRQTDREREAKDQSRFATREADSSGA